MVETEAGVEALTLTGIVALTEIELKAVVFTFGPVPLFVLLGVTAFVVVLSGAEVMTVEDGMDTLFSYPSEVTLVRSWEVVVVVGEEGLGVVVVLALERSWIVGM